jgi:hypothetical protein
VAIDEDDRLLTGPRRHEHLASAAEARGVGARLFDDVGRRGRRRRTIGQDPTSVLLDAERDALVAPRIEVRVDGGGRCQ